MRLGELFQNPGPAYAARGMQVDEGTPGAANFNLHGCK
jgi:hypothetical protein